MGRLPFLLLSFALGACGGPPPPPSILLVSVDTLRADALGSYGNCSARTPRMDRLAAEGVRFTACISPCPLTLPAHATILTGLLPPEHGLRDNDPQSPLSPRRERPFETLAEALSGAGYSTAAFVSASVLAARTGLAAGFSDYDGPLSSRPGELRFEERLGAETSSRAAKWLASAPAPFFLFVHLFDPHDPYEAPAAFHRGAAPGSPAAYAEEVEYADACVGILLDALESAGRADSTLVILASDHGEGLGEHGEPTHGYLLNEATLRVPLVVRWPHRVPAGVARPEVVGLDRIAPAVRAAAGFSSLDGTILSASVPGEIALSETLYGHRRMGWAQLFAAREGHRKVVRGRAVESFVLSTDPREESPGPGGPPDLLAAIDRYRALSPRSSPSASPLPEMAGFPYASGVGRTRLAVLPWADNEALPAPDPAFATAFDLLVARVGRDDRVPAELAALEAQHPENPSIPFWLGRAERAAGRPGPAAHAFGRAFDRGLAEAKVLNLWLQNLLLAGELEAADLVARENLSRVVPDCGTYLMLAALRGAQGRRPEAASLLASAEAAARTEADRNEVSRFRHNLGIANDK